MISVGPPVFFFEISRSFIPNLGQHDGLPVLQSLANSGAMLWVGTLHYTEAHNFGVLAVAACAASSEAALSEVAPVPPAQQSKFFPIRPLRIRPF